MTGILQVQTNQEVKSAPGKRPSSLPISVIISFGVIALVVLFSAFPSFFTSHSPEVGDTSAKLVSPGLQHWFGTDYLGRDVFSRVVHGSLSSVSSALVAVLIGLVVGSGIGLLAGFLGGWVDAALGRIIDVLLAIPGFLLAVVIVSSLGFQTINAAIATGVSAIAVFGRLMRAEVIKVRGATYVESSFLSGGNRLQALFFHILPNAGRSVLVLAILQFGTSIMVIASLAFLGYGDPPPSSDWGLLVASGKEYPTAPWLIYAPAAVIVATVLSVNRISRWLKKVR
ncbi:ABC transporter permease [Glutamicibacter ectropisis]|uniref:ABC transporter permease n=1 Tax=Glutamicibacter ectropisis TaxID=3046593 RepID=A0AAU6WD80_9MICC